MNNGFDRLLRVVSTLTRILIAPASNMKVAVLLYAMIAVILLIILVVGMMVIMTAPADKRARQVSREKRGRVRAQPRAATPMSRKTRLLLGLGIGAGLLSAWMLAGSVTSDPKLCKSCHWPASQHAKAEKSKDPHARVGCVSCHESGGVVRRFVTGVPLRLHHLAIVSSGEGTGSEYGQVTARACTSCHASALPRTSTNAERGLKVSHAEPLAASATCTDCHTMSDGIVGVHNAGMGPCLRCHDDRRASSACTTCHTGTVTAAARARTASFRGAQIREVKCSGCHDEKRDCDPCHGVRMPHPVEFKARDHARAGAVDLWFNGGKACRRCHTASRHPCQGCHTRLMGTAHGRSMAASHRRAASSACDTCHLQFAQFATRDFCDDVCHSPAAVAGSPR